MTIILATFIVVFGRAIQQLNVVGDLTGGRYGMAGNPIGRNWRRNRRCVGHVDSSQNLEDKAMNQWGAIAHAYIANNTPRRDGRFLYYTLTDGTHVTARSAANSERNWAGLSEECIASRLRRKVRDPGRLFAKNQRIPSRLRRKL